MTNGRSRVIPAKHAWITLQHYRSAFGFAPTPVRNDPMPLILSPFKWGQNQPDPQNHVELDTYKYITSRQGLYTLVTHAFKVACTILIEMDKIAEADLVSKASTNWLRHAYTAILADRAVSPFTIADNLGLSNANIVHRYISDHFSRRATAANLIDLP